MKTNVRICLQSNMEGLWPHIWFITKYTSCFAHNEHSFPYCIHNRNVCMGLLVHNSAYLVWGIVYYTMCATPPPVYLCNQSWMGSLLTAASHLCDMEEGEISSCHPVMSSFPDRPLLWRVLLQTTRQLMETCRRSLIGEPEKARREGGREGVQRSG